MVPNMTFPNIIVIDGNLHNRIIHDSKILQVFFKDRDTSESHCSIESKKTFMQKKIIVYNFELVNCTLFRIFFFF